MSKPASAIGRQLWELIPGLYRTKDEDSGQLARFLDIHGELLDRMRLTLDQRLADCFPDTPADGSLACQDWVLPYFADLLDVRLLSPHTEGRRAEVANAVRWRKRKGTVQSIEEISEGMTLLEVVVQEGWKRVATTPRIGLPLLPEKAFGLDVEYGTANPSDAAKHPGLPAVTIDQRSSSRAVATDLSHPLAQASTFPGEDLFWRQSSWNGVPCFVGSYEDISRRTVDVRTPDWRRGHAHPKRVLLYRPPQLGFFDFSEVQISWTDVIEDPDGPSFFELDDTRLFEQTAKDGLIHLYNPSLVEDPDAFADDAGQVPAVLTFVDSDGAFSPDDELQVEDLNFLDDLTIDSGSMRLERVAANRVVIDVTDAEVEEVVLDARDCLFEEVEVKSGTARLEYCTVLGTITCERLEASDCIFVDDPVLTAAPDTEPGCIRYSRVSAEFMQLVGHHVASPTGNTAKSPSFYDFGTCDGGSLVGSSLVFGDPGCGVLHPATHASICAGAEDGGEMGAYHHRRYCLATNAVLAKLQDFLPVGIEAALIPDPRLLATPPSVQGEAT